MRSVCCDAIILLCSAHSGAPPIPPPPPMGGVAPAGLPLKKPIIPNVQLPCLNWVPIRNPEHTVFKV